MNVEEVYLDANQSIDASKGHTVDPSTFNIALTLTSLDVNRVDAISKLVKLTQNEKTTHVVVLDPFKGVTLRKFLLGMKDEQKDVDSFLTCFDEFVINLNKMHLKFLCNNKFTLDDIVVGLTKDGHCGKLRFKNIKHITKFNVPAISTQANRVADPGRLSASVQGPQQGKTNDSASVPDPSQTAEAQIRAISQTWLGTFIQLVAGVREMLDGHKIGLFKLSQSLVFELEKVHERIFTKLGTIDGSLLPNMNPFNLDYLAQEVLKEAEKRKGNNEKYNTFWLSLRIGASIVAGVAIAGLVSYAVVANTTVIKSSKRKGTRRKKN